MQNKITLGACVAAVFAGLLLTACAARPQLLPKSAIVPTGVDLSGLWQLRDEPGSSPRLPDNAEQVIRIPPASSSRNPGRQAPRDSGRSGRAAVSVFIESGESLKITQTASGLFISFDRAVVEEYRFGEDRLASVGPIEAQRVSGWQDRRFVIETLDDGGAILAESWELADGGNVLVRTISLTQGAEQIFSSRQTFDRR